MLSYREYITAVARCRSFSKAAELLHVSQPWLSSAVKKTEQELGLALFDRSTNPVSLTEAGRYYVEQAERVSGIEEEMRQRFAQLRELSGRQLRIGSSMFFCAYVLPDLLSEFRGSHPDVKVLLTEGSAVDLSEKLLKGELDLMLGVEKPQQKGIVSELWSSEEILLAVPAANPINESLKEYCYSFEALLNRNLPGGRRQAVPLFRFAREPFLLLDDLHDIHGRSLEICRRAGFVPPVKLQLSQMMTAYYLVCEGQGVSFLRASIPEYAAPTDNVVFYELDDPLAVRNIYLSYVKREGSALREELIRYLEGGA